MKVEKLLMYAVPIGIAGAVVWWLMSQPPAPAARVPVTPAAPVAVPAVGVPTYTGVPSVGAVGATPELLAMASSQLGIPASELVVRSLRPQDFGLNSWNFTSTLVNTWENWVTATFPDNAFAAILGVAYGGTSFSQMRISAGAATSGIWPLSFISGLVSQLWYSAQPLFIQQNQSIIVDVISNAAATENVSIMGTIVEKAGITIA